MNETTVSTVISESIIQKNLHVFEKEDGLIHLAYLKIKMGALNVDGARNLLCHHDEHFVQMNVYINIGFAQIRNI